MEQTDLAKDLKDRVAEVQKRLNIVEESDYWEGGVWPRVHVMLDAPRAYIKLTTEFKPYFDKQKEFIMEHIDDISPMDRGNISEQLAAVEKSYDEKKRDLFVRSKMEGNEIKKEEEAANRAYAQAQEQARWHAEVRRQMQVVQQARQQLESRQQQQGAQNTSGCMVM